MTDETLLAHVADIIAAHVSNNTVASEALPSLIQSVHAAIAGLGEEVLPVEEERTPAVSIRASVKADALTCLECGVKMKMLKRHLSSDHGLTPADYRARWKLSSDYPMVAAEYSQRRKDLAVRIGLGRKPAQEAAKPARPAAKAAPKPVAPAAKAGRGRKKLGVAFESTAGEG